MKRFYFLLFSMSMSCAAFSQTAIGTTTPDPSAKFEVFSSTQGFLGPRIALTGTNDLSTIKNSAGTTVTPATGLMVYNTATAGTGSNAVTPGLYTFNGSSWDRVGSTSTTIVNATTVNSYRVIPILLNSPGYTGYDELGTIELPTGKWEVIGEYVCVIGNWGDIGVRWDLTTDKHMTYYLSSGGGGGVVDFNFPPQFNSGEITSDALVTGGAVVSIPFGEPQRFSFIINNTSASAKLYSLRFRESFSGVSFVYDGYSNYYLNSQPLNRLYAVKIQ